MNIVSVMASCYIVGWAVHKIFGKGNHGTGFLHYEFVGGIGVGIAALIEWITGHYAATLVDAIFPCFVYACIAEFIIRWIKNKLGNISEEAD